MNDKDAMIHEQEVLQTSLDKHGITTFDIIVFPNASLSKNRIVFNPPFCILVMERGRKRFLFSKKSSE